MPEKIISVRHLSKKFGSFQAIHDVSFSVYKGDVFGFLGPNGAGKSTLLKLLSRVTGPTTGEIKIKGRIASLLEVGTGFHPELTGRENVFLNGAIMGMSKQEIKNKFDVNYHFIGFKNDNDDFIEIAANLKSKTQFYSNSISDIKLLKTSREFESYRNKVNYNSFNLLKSDSKTYYSFFIENEKILKTTLIGIIEEYYVEINYYPNSENEPGEVDKLIELFQSIKLN